MNILFIVDGSLSNPVLSSQGIPHIKENSKKGINYSILSFEDMDVLKQDPKAKKRFDVSVSELKEYAQLISVKLKKNRRLSLLRFIFRGVLSGIRIVKKNKIEVIHGRSNLPSLIALFIKKFLNVKVLYDNRGLLSDEFDKKKRVRIAIEIIIEKYLLKKSDEIVVVSNAFKNYLSSKYPNINNINKKIKVIENSFSEERFVYSEQIRLKKRKKHNLDDKFIMVYSGHSVYWQRFDLVLTTFKLLKEIKKEAFLLIVSYDPVIKETILESGIMESDFSVHDIPASEVSDYLIAGDFGVVFRDNRTRSKVCAPIKLGEYLACGLPILCMSRIGDTDTIIKDFRVGVIIENEDNIKNKINEIIELTKEPNIGFRCRKAAENKLSLKSSAQKYYTLYKNLQ